MSDSPKPSDRAHSPIFEMLSGREFTPSPNAVPRDDFTPSPTLTPAFVDFSKKARPAFISPTPRFAPIKDVPPTPHSTPEQPPLMAPNAPSLDPQRLSPIVEDQFRLTPPALK
jgi:hypothetical protein